MSQAAHPLQLETTLQLFWCHFSAEHSNSLSAPSTSACNHGFLKYRRVTAICTLCSALGLRCGGPLANAHTALEKRRERCWVNGTNKPSVSLCLAFSRLMGELDTMST